MKLRLTWFFGESPLTSALDVDDQICLVERNRLTGEDLLNSTYSAIIQRNVGNPRATHARKDLKCAFQIVLSALEGLTYAELAEAVAVDDPTANDYSDSLIHTHIDAIYIQSITRNFLREINGRLEFTHLSAIEYLQGEDRANFTKYYGILDCHRQIMHICLHYVRTTRHAPSCAAVGDTSLALAIHVAVESNSRNFYSYAVRHWADHYAAVSFLSVQEDQVEAFLVNSVLCSEGWVEAIKIWTNAVWDDHSNSYEVKELCNDQAKPGFFIAACYGLPKLVTELQRSTTYSSVEVLSCKNFQRYTALISTNSLRRGLVAKLLAAPNISDEQILRLSREECPAIATVSALLAPGAVLDLFASKSRDAARLLLSCALGDISQGSLCAIIELFLEAGLDLTAHGSDGRTLLHIAAQHSLLEVMEWLLDHGLPLDFKGTRPRHVTALEEAVWAHQPNATRFLLQRGASAGPLQSENNLWHVAVQSSFNPSFAKALLDIESAFDGRNQQGFTPLMLAVMRSQTAWASHLVHLGASTVNVQAAGLPSLACCAASTQKGGPSEVAHMLQLLVRWGVDFNQCDVRGITPLMVAAYRHDLAMIRFLLQLGADPASTDHEGHTALHYVVHSADHEDDSEELLVLGALVQAGISIAQPDLSGITALMLAERSGKTELSEYLRNASIPRSLANADDHATASSRGRNSKEASPIEPGLERGNKHDSSFDFQTLLKDAYGWPSIYFAIPAVGRDVLEVVNMFEKGAALAREQYAGEL